MSLPENTRSCFPVRPVPRRNFLQDAINDSHSLLNGSNQNQMGTNAAIGVVMPTTPNSSLHHQQQNHLNEQLLHHTNATSNNLSAANQHTLHHNLMQNNILRRANISPDFTASEAASLLSMRVPDGAPQQVTIPNNLLQHTLSSAAVGSNNTNNLINSLNVEERLNQIQDCIRITASLINSIHSDKVSHFGNVYYLFIIIRLMYRTNENECVKVLLVCLFFPSELSHEFRIGIK